MNFDPDDPNSQPSRWDDGILVCCVDSPTIRLRTEEERAYARPTRDLFSLNDDEEHENRAQEAHGRFTVPPYMLERGAIPRDTLRAEVEWRATLQMVDAAYKAGLWPTNPRIRWERWNGQRWGLFLWPPPNTRLDGSVIRDIDIYDPYDWRRQ